MADTDSFSDTDILARTLWGEARGEWREGMEAVACVIRNRSLKPRWWGKDFRSVCLKPCQFSCWNKNDPNRPKMMAVNDSDAAFFVAEEIAEQAIAGSLPDTTCGATYYYAKFSAIPVWALGKKPCAEIGKHLFFNDVI